MARDDQQYSKTREDFDRMSLEDRTAFLIEGVFSTAAEALDRAGKGLADFVEEMEGTGKKQEREEDSSAASKATGEPGNDSADSPKTSSENSSND